MKATHYKGMKKHKSRQKLLHWLINPPFLWIGWAKGRNLSDRTHSELHSCVHYIGLFPYEFKVGNNG